MSAQLPARVQRYLLPTERVVVAVRRHPAQLLEPFGSAVAGFVLVLWLSLRMSAEASGLGDVLFAGWFLLLGRAAWRLLLWHGDWFVATDRRLLRTFGVFNRQVAMMPVRKVTDMRYNQSVAGRILHFGEFVMESAGQHQALRDIQWLPVPDQLYRRLCAEIFGVKDAAPVVPTVSRRRGERHH